MKFSRTLLQGTIWTVGSFSIVQLLRVATNVILARLLAPELFGIMQIVYSLRTGVELISDVGIGQNIIYNENANEPDFYNTAWTLQVIRGIVLWLVFSAAAWPAANFYRTPILLYIIPIAALTIVFFGFFSTSRFLLQKRMKFGRFTAFETSIAMVSSLALIIFAYFSPTVWALVFGNVVATAVAMIGSHFLLPDVRQRFFISRRYAGQILSFGKWIFASSIVYFLSANFDRLYLAKTIPLQLLGVYGIARTISELLSAAVQRLGGNVVFPFVASHLQLQRSDLRAQLAPIRIKFLLIAGFGFSIFATSADLAIDILYDQRYHAASWMLPVLVFGAWFAIMSNINESSLLGIGRPNYSVFGNGAKFGAMLIGMIWGVTHYGVLGGVIAVAVSELCRYVPIAVGQARERFSFAGQDLLVTAAVFGFIVFLEWLRWALGFGTSFDALPR
jgi:O-antigen/teichoic acid export membrane protein